MWILLAGAVDDVSSGVYDVFDGRERFAGGASGREPMREVLRYYGAQGDVQMSAMVLDCNIIY